MKNLKTGQANGNDHGTHTTRKGNAADSGLIRRGLKGLQHKDLGGASWTKESCSFYKDKIRMDNKVMSLQWDAIHNAVVCHNVHYIHFKCTVEWGTCLYSKWRGQSSASDFCSSKLSSFTKGEPQLTKDWWQRGPPEPYQTFARSGTPLMGVDATLRCICPVLTVCPLDHCEVPVGKLVTMSLALNGPTWAFFVQGGESHLLA